MPKPAGRALQVDPYMKIVGKMEDEVPAFFKRMRYPFAISKSALFAVGSPHTWPGLLAALVWLTDLLYYTEKAVSYPCTHCTPSFPTDGRRRPLACMCLHRSTPH